MLCNFIESALRHGRSPINFLHILRTPFPRNTSVWLLLILQSYKRLAWPNLTSGYGKILHTWQFFLVMKISTMSFTITAVFSVLNEKTFRAKVCNWQNSWHLRSKCCFNIIMFQSVKFLFSFTWGVTHYQTQCQYYETCAAGQNTSLRNEINIVCTPDPHFC